MFEITNQAAMKTFLGVQIQRNDNGTIVLTHPQLINSIVSNLGFKENSNVRDIPALSSKILQKHSSSANHSEKWQYRSAIGKLYYLENQRAQTSRTQCTNVLGFHRILGKGTQNRLRSFWQIVR
jgi:hypothetical protein